MAEFYFSLAIFVFVFAVMVAIGIAQVKSKDPVGFYTYEKPPKAEQIADVERWNKKHGFMWILYGTAILGSYLIAFFIERFIRNEVVSGIIMLVVIVGGIPVMVFYHSHLKNTLFMD